MSGVIPGHAREEFLRRYATSPIHVPRLERWLALFGDDEQDDAFCRRFIEWDRACADAEAARIVTEVLSASDDAGQIIRVGEDVVRGAIRWMSDVTWLPVAERARMLREGLTGRDGGVAAAFAALLATAVDLDSEAFRSAVKAVTERL